MVVVRVMGGVGNQLFQYALALVLRERGVHVALEKLSFDGDKYRRRFALDALPRRVALLNDAAARGVIGGGVVGRLRRWVAGRGALSVVREGPGVSWREAVAVVEGGGGGGEVGVCHVVGHWQCAELAGMAGELVTDLRELGEGLVLPDDLAAAVGSGRRVVGVHVRQKWEFDAEGVWAKSHRRAVDNTVWLGADYYARAVARVREGLGEDVVFAVFGDDEEWCRDHVLPAAGEGAFVVRGAGARGAADWEDLLLMARCDAVVCANSTFGWWAGFLCGGMVVAPESWSRDAAAGAAIRPASWEVV